MTPLLPSESALIQHDIKQLLVAGNGCMTLSAITESSAPSLIAAVMSGNHTSRLVLTAADLALRQIEERSHDRPLPCLFCPDGMLWRGEAPAAVVVLLPYDIEPVRTAVGFAVCACCAEHRTASDLTHAAVAKLRSGWMPDLRVLSVMEQVVGHA